MTNRVHFTPDNTGMLLIDHQLGTMSWVRSIPVEQLTKNAILLAQTARILDIPTVLTSSMEEYAQGPLIPAFQEILPAAYKDRIKRQGVVDAMHDPAFAEAVKKMDKKNLIVAGVTNDVCTVYPVLDLLEQGYNVQVVADGGGSPSKMADDIALQRMANAGAVLTTTNQLVAELAGSWTTPEGQQLVQEVMKVMPADTPAASK